MVISLFLYPYTLGVLSWLSVQAFVVLLDRKFIKEEIIPNIIWKQSAWYVTGLSKWLFMNEGSMVLVLQLLGMKWPSGWLCNNFSPQSISRFQWHERILLKNLRESLVLWKVFIIMLFSQFITLINCKNKSVWKNC